MSDAHYIFTKALSVQYLDAREGLLDWQANFV